MYHTRLHTNRVPRCAMLRWWAAIRRHTAHKNRWVAVSGASVLVAAIALMLHAMQREQSHRQSLDCLALNVYHEARGEPRAGQYAVAEVTMNRVSSGSFPDTVCDVVYEQRWDPLRKRHIGAFSWTELERLPPPSGGEWQRAREVADAVYGERHVPKLKGVLHYHAVYVKPSWARGRKPVARIGNHVFYRS